MRNQQNWEINSEENDMSDLGRLLNESILIQPRKLVLSAWHGHVPFAVWLIGTLKPRAIVELGTQKGGSYLAFCEAVLENRLNTKCYAVDTWKGDEYAGFYGEDIFLELADYHDQNYGSFSRLLRMTFDEAVKYFGDKSIDLLHIDGFHTYEVVKHDFETWLPKVSERGIVLFHDINVREQGFGVWKLWEELKALYPTIEFEHSHGLGVLFMSEELLPEAQGVFTAWRNDSDRVFIKRLFARLGQYILQQYEIGDFKLTISECNGQIATLNQALAQHDGQIAGLNQAVGERDAKIVDLRRSVSEHEMQLEDREGQITALKQMVAEAEKFAQKTALLASERERLATEASHLRGRLAELEPAVEEKDHQIFELRHSESYRFGLFCTWPLRKIWTMMKNPKQLSFLPRRLSGSSKHKEARRSILASALLPSGPRHLYRMAKAIHRHLPLPESWRVPLKQWVKGRLSGESPRTFPHNASIGAIKAARFRSLLPLRVYTAPRSGSCVNLVTDSVNAGSLFGGVATSIIFSALLAEKKGAKLRIITRTEKANEWNVRHVLECNSINWTKNIDFVFADIFNERVETEIGDRDFFVTTSWWTTSSVLRSIPEERVFYLLQEDERMFYPYGDDYLLCTELLKNSKLTFIINTKLLYDHFVESGFWNIRDRGIWFEPSFDIRTFFRESRGPREKKKFFFYARPNNLRNLFYRGLDAIERAVSLGTLELDGWELYFVGIDVPNVQFGSSYHPHRIGNVSWAEYGALVRGMDLALCLMYSPHPSYPPLDLAASGAVVVTNRFGQKKNLDMYSKNILCSDLDVDSLAAGIAQAVSLLADDAQREQNYRDSRFMRHWRASFEPILSRLD